MDATIARALTYTDLMINASVQKELWSPVLGKQIEKSMYINDIYNYNGPVTCYKA